jgi:predicted dehydrogenase
MLLHTGVHSFDLVRWLTGREVASVRCRTRRAVTVRTEDNFAAILDLEGGDALVCVNGSRATLGRSGLIDVAGAEGQVVGDHALGFAYAVRGLERTPLDLPPPAQTVQAVLADFVAVVSRGARPRATVEDGARSVLIAEACVRSATTGAAVPVPPL